MTERIYSGFANLQGAAIGTLRVGQLVARNPVRWQVRCEQCGSSWNELHTVLTSGGAGCRNASCGRKAPLTFKQFLAEEEAAQRQRQRAEIPPELIASYRAALS